MGREDVVVRCRIAAGIALARSRSAAVVPIVAARAAARTAASAIRGRSRYGRYLGAVPTATTTDGRHGAEFRVTSIDSLTRC